MSEQKLDYTPGQKNAFVKLEIRTVTGKLGYDRTWDYDTAGNVSAIPMYLSDCKIEYYAAQKKDGNVELRVSSFTGEDGGFEFREMPVYNPHIIIRLEHSDGKVTSVEGLSDEASETYFELKTGQVVWGRVDLDQSSLLEGEDIVDLGDVKITHASFLALCDMYSSVCEGHRGLQALTGEDVPFVKVVYPQSGAASFYKHGEAIHILKDDAKDRAVVLHEYGHFIIHHVLGPLNFPGKLYDYNDDVQNQHNPDSKEHLETAWNEAIATFLCCSIMDSPVYHDGYDANLTMNLETDMIRVGAHCEGSIQGALWQIYKRYRASLKDQIWKALTDTTNRTVRTVWEFCDNWMELRLSDGKDVESSLKAHGMEYRYDYLTGTGMYECVSPPDTFDQTKKEFQQVDELHTTFGSIGRGTIDEYNEEFYNRNNKFNPGMLDAGATFSNPKCVPNNKYIVPVRHRYLAQAPRG